MQVTDKLFLTNEDNMLLMSRYPDNHFDIAIVDPPYFDGPNKLGYYGDRVSSVGVYREAYEKIGTWDVPDERFFNELLRVSKHQIIWGCNYYAKHIPSVGRIVWDKVNGDSSFSDAEIASCSFHDSVRMFSYMWNGMMQGKSINQGKTQNGNKKLNEKRIHPTQKPVALYAWLLDKYATNNSGPVKILDTHLGGMSIAIACHEYGYELTGCEIDSGIYKKGIQRVKQHVSQQKLF